MYHFAPQLAPSRGKPIPRSRTTGGHPYISPVQRSVKYFRSRGVLGDVEVPMPAGTPSFMPFQIPGVTTPFNNTAPFKFYEHPSQNGAPASALMVDEEPMEEMVVTGTRIPWYVWALLGAVGISLLLGAKKS